ASRSGTGCLIKPWIADGTSGTRGLRLPSYNGEPTRKPDGPVARSVSGGPGHGFVFLKTLPKLFSVSRIGLKTGLLWSLRETVISSIMLMHRRSELILPYYRHLHTRLTMNNKNSERCGIIFLLCFLISCTRSEEHTSELQS